MVHRSPATLCSHSILQPTRHATLSVRNPHWCKNRLKERGFWGQSHQLPRLEEARPFILFKQQGIRFRNLLALEGLGIILQARAGISGEASRPSRTRKMLSRTLSKRGQCLMGHGGYQLGSASADEKGVEEGIKGRPWSHLSEFLSSSLLYLPRLFLSIPV